MGNQEGLTGLNPLSSQVNQIYNPLSSLTDEDADIFPAYHEEDTAQNYDEINEWQHSQVIHNISQQNQILQDLASQQENFNQQISLANYVKSLCQVHLGAGKLAADMLLQESWLLQNFETSEHALEERVQARLKDLQEAKRNKADGERRKDNKLENIEEMQNQLKDLDEEFNGILPDNQKAADWLTKVFKKKIKRKKDKKEKTGGEGEHSDSDSDSSDSDSDFSDDDDMSDEDGSEKGSVFDENVRPAQISEETYNKCLEFREQKLDIEENLAEAKKENEQIKKEVDTIGKKVKSFEGQLKAAKTDSEKLQQEKQKELNRLWRAIPMLYKNINHKLIQTPVKSRANDPSLRQELPKPKILNECLVLPTNTIQNLNNRIEELQEEKKVQEKLQAASRQTRIQLARQKVEKEEECKELQLKANQMMELRFGRVLDLDALEAAGTVSSRGIDELNNRIKNVEKQISVEHKLFTREIAEATDNLTAVTQQNTEMLKQLDDLEKIQAKLITGLQEREAGEIKQGHQLRNPDEYMTGDGDLKMNKEQSAETEQLEKLITMQTNKRNVLLAEIDQLSRKGGTVAPPK